MKEVKRSKNDASEIDFYLTILNNLKEGKHPTQIAKELNISKQKIYYYTSLLKELGFIEKKGYGVWEVKRSKKDDLEHAIKWSDKKIRGHAFIWQVKTKTFDWIKILENNKIPYALVRGYTPRILLGDKKIWFGKKAIIIYETKSFYGTNAIESRKYAVVELLNTLKEIEKQLNINLGKYYFKPTKEHYALIKNELARQCNDKGEKIIVRDDLDGEWLWIDDSDSLGELETGGKGFTKDRAGLNLELQNWWNDQKATGFKVTPSFLLEAINGVAKNQYVYAENIVSHVEAIKTLGTSVQQLTEIVKRLEEKK